MPIVSSEIVINRPDGAFSFVREMHTDSLGIAHPYEYAPALDITQIELDANLATHAIEVEANLAEQEIQQWISDINAGLDPAHIGHDNDTWFTNSVPEFNTWEIALDGAITPFLQSELREDMYPIKTLWGRLTNKEGEDVAGKPNDVAAELANETNSQAERDAYLPLVDGEGNPRA